MFIYSIPLFSRFLAFPIPLLDRMFNGSHLTKNIYITSHFLYEKKRKDMFYAKKYKLNMEQCDNNPLSHAYHEDDIASYFMKENECNWPRAVSQILMLGSYTSDP